jgi:hypothetical protein
MEHKQQDWTRVLIEPLSMNATKVHGMLFRLDYQEEIRMKEFNHLNDHLNKLIFSIEEDIKIKPSKLSLRLKHLRKSLEEYDTEKV